MPELVDNPNSSDDDYSEVGDLSGEYPNKGEVGLVVDSGGDAFTKTFTCAMLANTTGTAENIESEHYAQASRHMTAYRDPLENLSPLSQNRLLLRTRQDLCFCLATGQREICA
jgi:hypothetical protein